MFLKLRTRLIDWLAGRDITVVVNAVVYDYVLDANELLSKDCLFRRNRVSNLDYQINKEVNRRVDLARQGIKKQGDSFILDPSLK